MTISCFPRSRHALRRKCRAQRCRCCLCKILLYLTTSIWISHRSLPRRVEELGEYCLCNCCRTPQFPIHDITDIGEPMGEMIPVDLRSGAVVSWGLSVGAELAATLHFDPRRITPMTEIRADNILLDRSNQGNAGGIHSR